VGPLPTKRVEFFSQPQCPLGSYHSCLGVSPRSLEVKNAVEIDAKAVPIVIGKRTDPATNRVAAGGAPERAEADRGAVLQPHGGVERAGTQTFSAVTSAYVTLGTKPHGLRSPKGLTANPRAACASGRDLTRDVPRRGTERPDGG
jgi:hypothetical protein